MAPATWLGAVWFMHATRCSALAASAATSSRGARLPALPAYLDSEQWDSTVCF